jgi:hypothetical protein
VRHRCWRLRRSDRRVSMGRIVWLLVPRVLALLIPISLGIARIKSLLIDRIFANIVPLEIVRPPTKKVLFFLVGGRTISRGTIFANMRSIRRLLMRAMPRDISLQLKLHKLAPYPLA